MPKVRIDKSYYNINYPETILLIEDVAKNGDVFFICKRASSRQGWEVGQTGRMLEATFLSAFKICLECIVCKRAKSRWIDSEVRGTKCWSCYNRKN